MSGFRRQWKELAVCLSLLFRGWGKLGRGSGNAISLLSSERLRIAGIATYPASFCVDSRAESSELEGKGRIWGSVLLAIYPELGCYASTIKCTLCLLGHNPRSPGPMTITGSLSVN